jgi:hypothetical protein
VDGFCRDIAPYEHRPLLPILTTALILPIDDTHSQSIELNLVSRSRSFPSLLKQCKTLSDPARYFPLAFRMAPPFHFHLIEHWPNLIDSV